VNVDTDIDGETRGEINVGISDGYIKSSDYTTDMKSKSKAMGQNLNLPVIHSVSHFQTKRL